MNNTILTGETFLEQCKRRRAELGSKRCQLPQRRYDFTLPDLPPKSCWASLSEVCERVSVGHVGPTSQYFTDDKAGIPLVRSQDVRPGLFRLSNTLRITPEFHRKLKKSTLKSGDILFVRVGANRGDCCVVPPGSPEMNCANVVFARPLFPNGFFGFYFRSEFAQKLLLSATTGAAQGVINTESIARMPVPVPPPAVQEKLASILAGYDDLIANNTRRIKILQAMAQMTYREWFVDFRFPGYEKSRMVEWGTATIPQGWTASCVGSLAGEVRNSTNPSELAPDSPYVGLEHIPRESIALSEWGKAGDVQSTKLRFNRGDILFGKIRPYFHKVVVAPVDGVCSSDAIVIVPKKAEFFPLVLCCVSSDDFVAQATQTSQGTKMPRANWEVLTRYPVPLPEPSLLARFNDVIRPLIDLINNLIFRNRNLRQTRDLLLPKLISGDVNMERFEVETVAQSV
jgi:type I restriction enzyme, S subunit